MTNDKIKGYLCGAVSGASYGLIPLFSLPLLRRGVDFDSLLFYRYLIAAAVLGIITRLQGRDFALRRDEIPFIAALGVLFSLSSILIASVGEASMGAQVAAELATIALMANIFREIFTLLLSPLMVRWFSPLAPICAGGATTMDTTLPVITRFSGREWVFVSIAHGMVVDFSVPFLVPFFCSL